MNTDKGGKSATRMDTEEQRRLLRMIEEAEPGSAIAAAKEYGVDLTLNVRRVGMTPTERVEQMQRALGLVEAVRRAGREQRG